MNRVKSFTGTGIAPNGRLYPADLNAIQDAVAAEDDTSQVIKVGEIHIGETGLAFVRYAAGVARLEGSLRVDGGLYAGVFQLPVYTDTQRDAIATGLAPNGSMIYNSDSGLVEVNDGSDVSRDFNPVSPPLTYSKGTLGSDVSLPTANTFVSHADITLSLTAGIWDVKGYAAIKAGAGDARVFLRLIEGTTTVLSSAESQAGGANDIQQLYVEDVVTPSSTTDYLIRGAVGGTNGTLKAATPDNSGGNNATRIIAIKLG